MTPGGKGTKLNHYHEKLRRVAGIHFPLEWNGAGSEFIGWSGGKR